jgi:membrane-associated phospholipid phosphatase
VVWLRLQLRRSWHHRRSAWLIGLGLVAGFGLASLVDRPVYQATTLWVDRDLLTTGLFKLFRRMGYAPMWLLAAGAMALHAGGMARRRRRWLLGGAATLALSVLASGVATEVLKIVFRRHRPEFMHGDYAFRSWLDRPFSGSGLAFPSSHAGVAFGAIWVLCFMFPRAMPVWLFLAGGCALGRVLEGAHFVSDVYAGAVVALAIAYGLWRVHLRSQRVLPVEPS